MTADPNLKEIARLDTELAKAREEIERLRKEAREWKACAARTATERRSDEMRAIHERYTALAECARMRPVFDAAVEWHRTMDFGASRSPGEMFTCEHDLLSAIDTALTHAAKEPTR